MIWKYPIRFGANAESGVGNPIDTGSLVMTEQAAFFAATQTQMLILSMVVCAGWFIGYAIWTLWRPQHPLLRFCLPYIVPAATITVYPLAGLCAVLVVTLALVTHHYIPTGKRDTLITRLPYPLLLILLLAIVIRLPHMFEGIWYDEAWTVMLLSKPMNMWAKIILNDVHPPLYFLLLAPLRFGSVFMLRLPSLVFSLFSILLLYRLANRQFNQRVALTTALVAALLPSSIYYAAEMRSYALIGCLSLLQLIALVENRPRLFALAAAIFMWTHNIGYIYAIVLGVAAVAVWHSWRWIRWGAVAWLAGLLWLPGVAIQARNVVDGYWIVVTPGVIFESLIVMTGGRLPLPEQAYLAIPVLLVAVTMIYVSRSWLIGTRFGNYLLFSLAGVPLALILLSIIQPIFAPRYTYPALLPFTIVAGYALAHVVTLRRVLLGLAVVLLSVGYINARPDYRQLLSHHCNGATVLHHTSFDSIFTMGAVWDGQQTAWKNSPDSSLTYTDDDIDMFIPTADIREHSGHKVCVLQDVSPWMSGIESIYLHDLQARYRHKTTWIPINRLRAWRVFIFGVN